MSNISQRYIFSIISITLLVLATANIIFKNDKVSETLCSVSASFCDPFSWTEEVKKSYINHFLPEAGPTKDYWLIFIPLFSFISMSISLLAQQIACLWDKIEPDENKIRNRPSWNVPFLWLINHISISTIAVLVVAWSRYNDNVYEEDVLLMTIPQALMYILKVLLWVIVMVLIYDLLIYILHRASHYWKWIYIYIHRRHHENINPRSAFEGIYGDPFEGIIVGCFAICQMIVLPAPYSAFFLFLGLISLFVQFNHSGRKVELPFLFYTARYHHYHHKYFKVNFAEHFILWDYLFGTLYVPDGYEAS